MRPRRRRRMARTIEVVAALIRKDDRFLVCQRPPDKARALMWEFPGGKIEPGETPEQALVREIHEELEATVAVDDFLITVEYDYPKFHLTMHCFACHVAEGQLKLLEHSAAKWLTVETLDSVDWLPADAPVIEAIREKVLVD